jgi:CheY-like chemotaxis protein
MLQCSGAAAGLPQLPDGTAPGVPDYVLDFRFVNTTLSSAPAVRRPNRTMSAKRVLVVDDEEAVRLVLKTVLASAGFHVVEAAGGEEAVRQVRNADGQFDAVLLDQHMPGLSSTETLRLLRQHLPPSKIVLLSGMPILEPEAAGSMAGERFLPKPFANEELVRVVREAAG